MLAACLSTACLSTACLSTACLSCLSVVCLLSHSLRAQDDPAVQEVVRLAKARDWKGAMGKAQSITDPSLRVLALCNLAKRQLLADERGAAKISIRSVPELARKIDDTFARIKAIGFLAEIQIEAGDSIAGHASLQLALRDARADRDVRGAIAALVDIGKSSYRRVDIVEGRKVFAAACALAENLESSQERVALLLHIDKFLTSFKDRQGRKLVLAAVMPLAQQLSDTETTFKVLLTIGDKQLSIEDRSGFGETMAVARSKAGAMTNARGRARMLMVVTERLQAAGLMAEARWALRDLKSHRAMLEGFAKKPEFTATIQDNADTTLAYALLQIEVDDRALGWAFLKEATTHMRVKQEEILTRALHGLMQRDDWGRALEAATLLSTYQPDSHVRRLDQIWHGSLESDDFETADLVAPQYSDLSVHLDRRLELTRHLAQGGHPEIARACLEIAQRICAAIEEKDDAALVADPAYRAGSTLTPFPDLARRSLCVQGWINLGCEDEAARAVMAAVARAESKRDAEGRVDALLALAETFQDLDLLTQQPRCWEAAVAIAKDAKHRDVLLARIADSQAFAGSIVPALATVALIGRDTEREKCRERLFERSIAAHASALERGKPVADRIAIARSFADSEGRFDAYVALTIYYVGIADAAILADDTQRARRAAADATAWLTPDFAPEAAHAQRYTSVIDKVAGVWSRLGDEARAAGLRKD